MGARKFSLNKKKWVGLESYVDKVVNELDRWSCCFITEFSFETVIYGKKQETRKFVQTFRDSILEDVNVEQISENFERWDNNNSFGRSDLSHDLTDEYIFDFDGNLDDVSHNYVSEDDFSFME